MTTKRNYHQAVKADLGIEPLLQSINWLEIGCRGPLILERDSTKGGHLTVPSTDGEPIHIPLAMLGGVSVKQAAAIFYSLFMLETIPMGDGHRQAGRSALRSVSEVMK